MCHWGWALPFQKPMLGPVCLYLSLTVFLSVPPLQTRKEPSVKPMLQHQGTAVEGVFFPTAWLAEQPSLNAAKIWARMLTPITVPLVQMTVVLESITGHVLCRTVSRQCFPSSPKVGSGRLCVTVVVRSGVFGGQQLQWLNILEQPCSVQSSQAGVKGALPAIWLTVLPSEIMLKRNLWESAPMAGHRLSMPPFAHHITLPQRIRIYHMTNYLLDSRQRLTLHFNHNCLTLS